MAFKPTLRQLSFLVALYEHRNFSRAAESSLVTQSTMSAAIQELEAGLGAALVERTKRVVRFTELGEEVVRQARVALGEVDRLVEMVKGAGEPLTGALRLGVIPTIGPFVLPKLLPALKKGFPALKLFLREGQTEATLARVKSGTLDAGLIAFPYPVPGLEVSIIGRETFTLVMPASHPLAVQKAVAIETIDPAELLLLEEGHCMRDHALSVCQLNNLKAGEEFKATSLETLVLMVAEGLGLTLVPEMAIGAGLLKGKNLVAKPLKGAGVGREIGLCWRSSNPRGEEFKLLAGAMEKILYP